MRTSLLRLTSTPDHAATFQSDARQMRQWPLPTHELEEPPDVRVVGLAIIGGRTVTTTSAKGAQAGLLSSVTSSRRAVILVKETTKTIAAPHWTSC